MKKIWVLAGIVSLFVIIISLWFFVGKLSNFAYTLGDTSKEVVNDDETKFIGTWATGDGSTGYIFHSDKSFYNSLTGYDGTWEVKQEELLLTYSTGYEVQMNYLFSDNDNNLALTLFGTDETILYIRS